MSLSLENPFLQFAPDLSDGSWSLYSRQYPQTYFENIRMKVSYRQGGSRYPTIHKFQAAERSRTTSSDSAFGRLNQVTLVETAQSIMIKLTLTFALPELASYLLWQLNIENVGPLPVQIDKIELLRLDQTSAQMHTKSPHFHLGNGTKNSPALAFFSNGWQSWNYTGVYGPHDRFRATHLGPITSPMRVNYGRPRPKTPGYLVSDMFAVLGDHQQRFGALAGFLSQQQQFGTIETRLRGRDTDLHLWANGDGARLAPCQLMATDWVYLSFVNLDEPDPLGSYFETVARQYGLLPAILDGIAENPDSHWPPALTGWCSWHQFYGKVTARDIHTNLRAASQLVDRLPIEVIQIDDGFETRVGDWYSFTNDFPDGVAPLAADIRAAGFIPGLWLAPFTVLPSSKVAADHPEWLLRGRFNRPVNAGYNTWGEFSTVLDLSHPEALRYAQEVVQTAAHQSGFPYLKLDYLYAGALSGKYRNPALTRAQILRNDLQALRDGLGQEITLVGCGCPLGSAIGLVDVMRIGADVSDRWKPVYAGIEFFFEAEPDYPSTRNAIQNILTRAGMHRRWRMNDPDCLLVRPETRLSLTEIQSLATAISLSGGSFFLSDDLPVLSEERIQLAVDLLPPLPGRARVIDWFDSATPTRMRLDLHNQTREWSLLAAFNWSDSSEDLPFDPDTFGLPAGRAYWVREFWRNETHYLPHQAGSRLLLKDTAPHGVQLLAVRPARANLPCYLGSSLHVSQGLEVTGWQKGKNGQYIFHLDFNKTAELQLGY